MCLFPCSLRGLVKQLWQGNFKEVKMMENEMLTLVGKLGGEDSKTRVVGKKPCYLTKPTKKEPTDVESALKLIKKLSNELFDIKRNPKEGTYN
jgi:hypothetical protein